MTKAVAKADNLSQTAVAINDMANALAGGANEFGLSAADIRIETLLVMQPASGMVSDGKAKLGDVIRNDSEKVIANVGGSIEVIALYKFDTIRMYQSADGKFVKEIPYKSNVKVDKEGVEDNVPVRRYHTINFFFLLTEDIKAGEFFPVLMRLKSTSFQAGSKFASFLYKKSFFKKLPYEFTGILEIAKDKNEKNQHWARLDFKEGRPTTEEEQMVAKQMVALINAKKYIVNEAEDSDDAASGPAAATQKVVQSEVVGQSAGEY